TLAAEARRRPRDARALTDWGLYLHHVAPEDPERRLAAEVLAQAANLQPTPEAYARLATAQSDPNDQRKALEEGLAHLGSRPTAAAPLKTQLGELYSKSHRERRAEELWHEALAADPRFYPAAIKLAELEAERGLPARAAAELAAVAEAQHSPSLKVLRAR